MWQARAGNLSTNIIGPRQRAFHDVADLAHPPDIGVADALAIRTAVAITQGSDRECCRSSVALFGEAPAIDRRIGAAILRSSAERPASEHTAVSPRRARLGAIEAWSCRVPAVPSLERPAGGIGCLAAVAEAPRSPLRSPRRERRRLCRPADASECRKRRDDRVRITQEHDVAAAVRCRLHGIVDIGCQGAAVRRRPPPRAEGRATATRAIDCAGGSCPRSPSPDFPSATTA